MLFAYVTKGLQADFAYSTTLLPLFGSVRGLTLCLLFAVASNGEVSFSMTVLRFRRVEHRMRRFTFFC